MSSPDSDLGTSSPNPRASLALSTADKIKLLRKELRRVMSENEQHVNTIEQQTATIDRLQAERDTLETDLESSRVSYVKMKRKYDEELEEVRSRLELEIAEERERLQTEIAELRAAHEMNEASSIRLFPQHEGWLDKMGGRRKNLKRRYFRLLFIAETFVLHYFETIEAERELGAIILRTANGRSAAVTADIDPEKYGSEFAFEIHPPDDERTYVLFAASLPDKNGWLDVIKAAQEWQ